MSGVQVTLATISNWSDLKVLIWIQGFPKRNSVEAYFSGTSTLLRDRHRNTCPSRLNHGKTGTVGASQGCTYTTIVAVSSSMILVENTVKMMLLSHVFPTTSDPALESESIRAQLNVSTWLFLLLPKKMEYWEKEGVVLSINQHTDLPRGMRALLRIILQGLRRQGGHHTVQWQ